MCNPSVEVFSLCVQYNCNLGIKSIKSCSAVESIAQPPFHPAKGFDCCLGGVGIIKTPPALLVFPLIAKLSLKCFRYSYVHLVADLSVIFIHPS